MPETPTIEERIAGLEQQSVALKQKQLAIREERRALLAERTRLVFVKRIRDELGGSRLMKAAVESGVVSIPGPDDLTMEQAADLLHQVRSTKRPGDVRVEPTPGQLGTVPGSPAVEGGDA